MMSGKKCSYKDCTNTSKTVNLSFFTFPVSNKERCNLWIVNSGRDDFAELQDRLLRHRVLCSDHFKDNAFTDNTRRSLLKSNPNTVPVPWFDLQTSRPNSSDDPQQPETIKDFLQQEQSVGHSLQTTADNLTSLLRNSSHLVNSLQIQEKCNTEEESLEQFNADFQLITHNSNNKLVDSPTPRKKKLLKSLSAHRVVIKRSRSKISFLQKRKNPHSLLDMLKNKLSGDTLTLVMMQIRHQKHRPWNQEEKNIALSLYYKSPSTYRFLRDRGFKLPCVTLIRKWINVCNLAPGFSNEVLLKLKNKTTSMTDDEKQCVLLMDEMAIKKALEYDQKSDLIEGFEDLGPLGRSSNIGSHALLFMLRGLKCQWKCPIAYFISNNSVKSSTLALLVDMCIDNVFKTGLTVRAIVCDQGSTNAAAVKLMGVSENNPYLYFGPHKIHFLYDVPHVMKSVRNNLMKYDFEVEKKIVSWRDLRSFYDVDTSSNTDSRSAPKLSERHVNPHNFQKMNVKLATQVFSFSVSQGMQAACSTGLLNSPTAVYTAKFFKKMNDIFDCLNSKYCFDSNPLRRPLSSKNEQVVKCLEAALPFINTWKALGAKNNPPCFKGLVLSITSVLSLYGELKSDRDSYLLTSRLNQDPIENMFGVIRQRGGYNNNPSAKQFRRNLQHAVSIRLMSPPGSANCEADSDITLEVNQCIVDAMPENPLQNIEGSTEDCILSNTSMDSPFKTAGVSVSDFDPGDTSLLEDNVIKYIAGWLIRKLLKKFHCENCVSTIQKTGGGMDAPREEDLPEDILLRLKAFTCYNSDKAQLYSPSDFFFNIVRSQVICFTNLYKCLASQRGLHDSIVSKIQVDTERLYEGYFTSECREHRLYMLSMLVKCKLYYAVKWLSNDLRDKALINHSKKRKRSDGSGVKLNQKLRTLKHI